MKSNHPKYTHKIMRNKGTTDKKYSGFHYGLVLRLRDYDPETPQPFTVFCRGIVVTGHLMSYAAYVAEYLKTPDEGEEVSPKQQAIVEKFERIRKQAQSDPFFEPNSFVLKNATVHAANYVQKTDYWIGNIESVDGYETGFWYDLEETEEIEE